MNLLLVLIVSLVVFVLLCLVSVVLPLRYSAAIRTLEAACGLGAAVAGCLGLAYALFGPVYSFQTCSGYGGGSSKMISCQTGTANMFQVGISPSTFIILGILLLIPIVVAVSTTVRSRTGGSRWRIVLWVGTLALVILTVLTGFSIGLFLFPGTLLALLASAFSLGARRVARG